MTRPYLVFCDVDETLVSCKSMFDFLEFRLLGRHGPKGAVQYRRIVGELHAMVAGGQDRAEVNRAYYRRYAGELESEVRVDGHRWFQVRSAGAAFFIAPTLEALWAHRAQGARLVLVSGSFDACLQPLAHAVRAQHLLCTRPVSVDGRYTGDIAVPMIGENKMAAAQALLRSHPDIDPADCYAYGDHPSDIPMLRSVGHPVAVGDDASLHAYVASRQL